MIKKELFGILKPPEVLIRHPTTAIDVFAVMRIRIAPSAVIADNILDPAKSVKIVCAAAMGVDYSHFAHPLNVDCAKCYNLPPL